MTVDVSVLLPDGSTRLIQDVTPSFHLHWIDLVQRNGDEITLNFRAWSLREIVPEKIKTRLRDGVVIDNGSRVTGSFEAVTIRRRSRKGGSK